MTSFTNLRSKKKSVQGRLRVLSADERRVRPSPQKLNNDPDQLQQEMERVFFRRHTVVLIDDSQAAIKGHQVQWTARSCVCRGSPGAAHTRAGHP